MRLFTALVVPASIAAALHGSAPSAASGVRPVPAGQMHVTLQFIGDADVAAVRTALAKVRCRPLPVSVRGVGRFDLAGGGTILWAGVDASQALAELHAACARALAAIGIASERRRFRPHVTVARLAATAAASVAVEHRRAGAGRHYGDFLAEEFVLFDSVTRAGHGHYDVVESYRLR